MMVTLTANPSMDRTVTLETLLTRGGVHRASSSAVDPGGKGVNVARVLGGSGVEALAVLPANVGDPILDAMSANGVRYSAVPTSGPARTNITVSEIGGTTTKINEPGATVSEQTRAELRDRILTLAVDAEWVVLSGSLPPGLPVEWYAELVVALRATTAKVAVDTSDEPLLALADRFPESAPDLIKPNSEELAQLTGYDSEELESAAAQGDPSAAVSAATILLGRGVGAVLATLGSAGAVLVTQGGAWYASPPPITAVSTVGAGDSSLAGYILADVENCSDADKLRRAVAYGTAATALPGTTLPLPEQTHPTSVTVRALDISTSVTPSTLSPSSNRL
ncbi:1-phosphofructokinase family hexose kinase [Rhodococcus fascians]|nr:1-phosphofructokinase family hexose kinase [Rhodococcus fascians]MBY3995975.1 1-phosphofructokinase family hexose kinase [Rhodococcus fascians]MBY4001633.1 1-phosphofructokinase family hexose kinase [Rhodococcus fascians]MBY4006137.1 1-phosphofructokinase family hexose kinase [Rhodococcus fascians]MBY4017288.1 1-phosphofructokinase family hexose kinase [Rhodococcus fascians]